MHQRPIAVRRGLRCEQPTEGLGFVPRKQILERFLQQRIAFETRA